MCITYVNSGNKPTLNKTSVIFEKDNTCLEIMWLAIFVILFNYTSDTAKESGEVAILLAFLQVIIKVMLVLAIVALNL